MNMQNELEVAIQTMDWPQLKSQYWEQDEFLVIENFLPASIFEEILLDLPNLRKAEHRNYVPFQKKGSSISRFAIEKSAPTIPQLYHHPKLNEFAAYLTDEPIFPCPASDPHSFALYLYTEPGDHIGFHYDTSFYKGKRFTALICLIDHSSCQFVFDLHSKNSSVPTKRLFLNPAPRSFVIFNGDKLYHKITPLGLDEERIVLTMEYVTNPKIKFFPALISNIKDAFAYFGVKEVFLNRYLKK